ncbi:histidine phosphatase family protein [Sphingomonas desiccabilis]|uniref:Histidine phosphatase family protein n=1 Tax=Sphingomonas desiccabilis TaxID=429134 RepID=A0A4Q2J0R6_9SPHN|nr:histidine phosphatase family protein [Sphingomonas desiccabilis]MBB3910491.1 alpha-ribazole phosphatase [Sphingomonas desiccabilis]RXZ35134.1 histidine phosphatase family protein [Sphingomonas desiccabilis]
MRHGEPALAGRLLGSTDCDVLPAGVRACRSAAAGLAFSRVIASDLRRSADCAAAIAADKDVALRLDSRWRELDFGRWDGRSPEDVDATALRGFWDDPDGASPPGGERWSTLLARVAQALEEVEDASLIVTHAGAMRAALVAACGFDRRQSWAFDLPYACVLSLRLWRGEAPTAQILALRP